MQHDFTKRREMKMTPEMESLANKLIEHLTRKEGESEAEYSRRLDNEWPRMKYAELPIEFKAWVDVCALDGVREFVSETMSPLMRKKFEAEPDKLEEILKKIPHCATWIVQAFLKENPSGEAEAVGISPNLTGSAMLEAWKEITGTDLVETAGELELTQLIATGKVIFPTAKAFWKQPIIAQEGPKGVALSVDKKNTLITASISTPEGENIKITPEQQHLQATIGQMIMENGAPITVTPAQLYRAFAGLPADSVVTEEQEDCMVKALDPLLKTAAQLDFTQEVERHTKIKRDPNYDYSKTRLTGSLVTGMKVENGRASYNGKSLDVAYIIYDAPMYFAYSKAINQLATVDRAVLLGGGASKNLPAGHPDQKPIQRRARNIVLRRYLMAQVERIKRERDKNRNAAQVKKHPPHATHTEHLTFDTIAAACDIALTDKLKRQLRHDVKIILLDFKYNGYIRDTTEYKEGRAIKGMEITV